MKKPTLTAVGGTDVPEAQNAAEFYRTLETDTLARTLWGEARGEGHYGMEAVASVILNRVKIADAKGCLLYTSPSPRDAHESRMPSSA